MTVTNSQESSVEQTGIRSQPEKPSMFHHVDQQMKTRNSDEQVQWSECQKTLGSGPASAPFNFERF
jgi:hypothetical protein